MKFKTNWSGILTKDCKGILIPGFSYSNLHAYCLLINLTIIDVNF